MALSTSRTFTVRGRPPRLAGRISGSNLDDDLSFFRTARWLSRRLGSWGTCREARDGQNPGPTTGSRAGAAPRPPALPGLQPCDADPLREPPHAGDACRHGAAARDDPALRGRRLCPLPQALPPGGRGRSGLAAARVRPRCRGAGGRLAPPRSPLGTGDPRDLAWTR